MFLTQGLLFHLPMNVGQIKCSETSAYINQTSGNYPKEKTLYSEQGEILKSIMYLGVQKTISLVRRQHRYILEGILLHKQM